MLVDELRRVDGEKAELLLAEEHADCQRDRGDGKDQWCRGGCPKTDDAAQKSPDSKPKRLT